VIHAGIYYQPGSLKARLCVQGARELFEYCASREIAAARCGKLILATRSDELGRLEELERRAHANGVADARLVGPREIAALEPHARAIAALHSPSSGVVAFDAVARAFARDLCDAGGAVATGCEVRAVTELGRGLRLEHSRGALQARNAVFCAGAWADRLARIAGAGADPRIVPFRGAYLALRPERRALVRGLIYPVPDPALPFLGVHLTRTIAGDVLVGPTALLAAARDAYRPLRARGRDLLDALGWPGTWRLLARHWRSGASELRRAALRGAFVRDAARLVPELTADDVVRSFAGIRAQALGRDGRLLDDFAFSATPRALHVRNAPSPAATSSLAIARHVADAAERAFAL
jgi:2-hydroxyglutarate dehydrogenase